MAFIEDFGNSGNAENTVSPSPAGSNPAACPSSEEGCPPPSQPAGQARENPSSEHEGGLSASTARAAPGASGASPQGTQPDHMMPFLGMHMNHGPAYAPTDRSYDYTKKYPADPEGKEAAPEARFWKVYLDEAEIYDTDMVVGFRNTLDGTLVFAALFSSIITSFIIEASQKLEPDFAQINASLLVENNLLLRAGGNSSKIDAVRESPLGVDSVTYSWPDVLMNGVFFASLSLALMAALFSILVKQWLQTFTTVIRGDTKERCLIRQLRFTGLQKWKLSEIINALPMFLHVSLALFFMGLGIFVRDFHLAIRFVVNAIACATAAVYLTTLILPAIYIDCPYRLPFLHVPASFVVHLVKQVLHIARCRPLPLFQPSPFFSQEQEHASDFQLPLSASCISWLFTESTNHSVRTISVRGAAGLSREHGLLYWPDGEEKANLPITEMFSFILDSWDTLLSTLAEQLPLIRSLANALHQLDQTPSANVWNMALRTPALLDLFLQEGVDLDVPYSSYGLEAYPFQHACNKSLWDTAIKLLPHIRPSHLAAFGDFEKTPLMLVCQGRRIAEQQQLTLVQSLLTEGAKVGDVDKGGENALHYAVRHQGTSLEILDTLLSNASPFPASIINQQNSSNETPLFLAAGNCSPSYIRALLSAGANPNILTERGQSPLGFACSRIADFAEPCDFEVFERLVDATTSATIQIALSKKAALDFLVDHRLDTDEVTFAKAYKLMRGKGAQCIAMKEFQYGIDAELGVTKEEE